MSTHPYFSVASLKAFLTDSKLARFGLIPATIALGYFSFNLSTATSADFCELAANTTEAPSFKNFNAAARLEGMSYSKLMGALHKAGIEINRKVLADLAMNHPEAFKAVVAKAKAA